MFKRPLADTGREGSASLARALRTFRGAGEGAIAVEFALVMVPFLGFIGGILQFVFIIWAGQNLDTSVQRAARNLFTGSFQNANVGITNQTTLLNNLRTTMCGSGASASVTVFSCNSVKLNIAVASSFASGAYAVPYDAGTKAIRAGFDSYACAKPGQIVVVTAAVAIPTFFKLLNPGFVVMGDGSYLMQSTAVFRTEPYQTANNTGC